MKKVVKNIFSLVIIPLLIALFLCMVIGNDFSYFLIALLVVCAVYYPIKFALKSKNKLDDTDYSNYKHYDNTATSNTDAKNKQKSDDEQFFEDMFLYDMYDEED